MLAQRIGFFVDYISPLSVWVLLNISKAPLLKQDSYCLGGTIFKLWTSCYWISLARLVLSLNAPVSIPCSVCLYHLSPHTLKVLHKTKEIYIHIKWINLRTWTKVRESKERNGLWASTEQTVPSLMRPSELPPPLVFILKWNPGAQEARGTQGQSQLQPCPCGCSGPVVWAFPTIWSTVTGSAFLQRLFPLVFGNTHRYPCTLMRILYA